MPTPQHITGCNAEKVNVVKSWTALVQYYESLRAIEKKHWLFRGVRDATYRLEPSLERRYADWKQPSKKGIIEEGLLRRFQRWAGQYIDRLPGVDERLEWLAVMQHYGAPTRLLDWTYSFYVASFFALESATDKSPCAIWDIHNNQLCDAALRTMPKSVRDRVTKDAALDKKATSNAILQCSTPFVYQVTPFYLNTRLAVQRGTFLTHSAVEKTFVDCLGAINIPLAAKIHRIELAFSQDNIQEALTELRQMNIGRTSLFPGIDGFAADIGIYGFDPTFRMTAGTWDKRKRQM